MFDRKWHESRARAPVDKSWWVLSIFAMNEIQREPLGGPLRPGTQAVLFSFVSQVVSQVGWATEGDKPVKSRGEVFRSITWYLFNPVFINIFLDFKKGTKNPRGEYQSFRLGGSGVDNSSDIRRKGLSRDIKLYLLFMISDSIGLRNKKWIEKLCFCRKRA